MNTNKVLIYLCIVCIFSNCDQTKNLRKDTQLKNKEFLNQFEGEITYSHLSRTKDEKTAKIILPEYIGNQEIYKFKRGKYISISNGTWGINRYYLGGDTLYTEMGNLKKIFSLDISKTIDEIINYEIINNAATINGIKCNLLDIKTKNGFIKYYFNKKYALDPKDYQNYKNSFWDFCVAKTKSIPIKKIHDSSDIYFELEAQEIKEMKIDDSEFKLPNIPRGAMK